MIKSLYPVFQPWSDNCSVLLISDTHFDDKDCLYMDPFWIKSDEQVKLINQTINKNDTFIHLGDVGDPKYIPKIHAKHKILLLGNHDRRADYTDVFDEIYTGPLFIADRILLSHEPVYGLPWCLNIHGHDHNNVEPYKEGCPHLNIAANVCNYIPVNLGKIIKNGVLANIKTIHRMTIDGAKDEKDKTNV